MIQEITLHGRVEDSIEFYATIAGRGLVYSYFYEPSEGSSDRFFFGGREFVIDKEGIRHKGNGGSVCEYMFGVEQPLKDMVRRDVLNRLAMYGALFDNETGKVVFTDKTDGYYMYDRVFLEGNAVSNYYFFIDIDLRGDIGSQQEQILKLVGKTLKYSPAVGKGDDVSLIAELTADLDGYNPVIFLFRLVNRFHKRYYDLFRDLYAEKKEISPEGEKVLTSLVEEFNIDQYQQERIKIDVIYNHPENRRVLDEYKEILISLEKMEEIDHSYITSLNRLRSLAMKNNIPLSLFDLLDELLLKDKKLIQGEEPDYIKHSRALLDGLFIIDGGFGAILSKQDLVKLLFDKKRSLENRDLAFDSLLLDIGKACDDSFQKGDSRAMERFSELITYFDRFDTTSSMISRMAFMDEDMPIEKLRSILGNKRAIEEIQEGLFESLFISDLLKNKYISSSGRRKVIALSKGLDDVEKGYKSLNEIVRNISLINEEDRTFHLLYNTAREKLKKIPGAMEGKGDYDKLLKETLKDLLHEGPVKKIPRETMKRVFIALKMEIFYVNDILPKIMDNFDMKPREDFLHNSGFDRFYVEDIERQYMERYDVPQELVKSFREAVEH